MKEDNLFLRGTEIGEVLIEEVKVERINAKVDRLLSELLLG